MHLIGSFHQILGMCIIKVVVVDMVSHTSWTRDGQYQLIDNIQFKLLLTFNLILLSDIGKHLYAISIEFKDAIKFYFLNSRCFLFQQILMENAHKKLWNLYKFGMLDTWTNYKMTYFMCDNENQIFRDSKTLFGIFQFIFKVIFTVKPPESQKLTT